MIYEVLIDGGFPGIPKKYQGEIELPERDRQVLQQAMEQPIPTHNNNLRDGHTYHLKLIEGEDTFEVSYNEVNLPLEIRQFIDTISKQSPNN